MTSQQIEQVREALEKVRRELRHHDCCPAEYHGNAKCDCSTQENIRDLSSALAMLDPVAETPIADLVRIWSGEHSAWWRPEGGGYTQQRSEAWITDRDSAVKWTCHCGQEKRIELQPICRACGGSGEREVGTGKGGCPCPNCMGTGNAEKEKR